MAALAARQGIDPVPVLPLRLSLLDGLLDALCIDASAAAAVYLRCGRGGGGRRPAGGGRAGPPRPIYPAGRGDPAGLSALLLRRWGVSPGDGGLPVALTVCTGHSAGSQ